MGYPKQVYERAWEILDKRARAAREQASSRRREALSAVPEIEALEREMSALAAKSIYMAAAGGDGVAEAIEELGRESLRIQNKRAGLLLAAGYPEDYLAERHTCALCRDKGYLGTEMCACLRELLRAEAFSMLSDYPQSLSSGFQSFNLAYYPQEAVQGVSPRRRMADILDYCRHYADTFSLSSPSLLMMGRTGLGKTHLSLAIAACVIEKGFGVIYTPVQKLCDRLEAGKFSYQQENRDRYSQELSAALECDLLVLDDLGTEFVTAFSTAAIGNIINSRLMDGRPTIVSTNLDLGALEKQYSQRMASRLGFSYKVLAFIGEDVRYLMRTEGKNKK